jgi:FAD synthase
MRAELIGRVNGPSVVVVGSWDPFVPEHQELIEQLASDAREKGLASVVVLLDPNPPVFVWGRHDWPVYDELQTRIQLVFGCGVDGLLLVHMMKADTDAGAEEFLAILHSHLTLAELRLGIYQTLGIGPRGATAAINELAEQQHLRIIRMLPRRLPTEDVRKLLAVGLLKDAIRIVGRPPVRRRPNSRLLRLAWAPGVYRAVSLESPTMPTRVFTVELVNRAKHLPALEWPDRGIRYLAFVSGPADAPDSVSKEDSPS